MLKSSFSYEIGTPFAVSPLNMQKHLLQLFIKEKKLALS